MDMLKSGKIDLLGALYYEEALTLPWYSLPISKIFNECTEYSENGKIAAPYFLKNVLPPKDNVTYFDTVEECLLAVQKGVVNYSFVGELCSQYYFNMPEYKLKKMNQTDIANQKLCFGIYNTNSPYLHTIFNKIITILPAEKN